MSTFNGLIAEFPYIRIDNFTTSTNPTRPRPLAVFLSHVHTDHLGGLQALKSPFVYCSHATRQLLLRLETRRHRLNFAQGVLETRTQTYKHLRRLLRPIPLSTPTVLELAPGESLRVTLLDANHCPGAVMFLLERPGGGRAALYTGDIRAELWWVNALARDPSVVPYVSGLRRLDCIYLDTTFAVRNDEFKDFEPKQEGIAELLRKVSELPADTVYYFNAWTFGYEEVLVALAAFLNTKVHIDEYRWKLYHNMLDGEGRDIRVSAPLVGFQEGHRWHNGCFTSDEGADARIHICEKWSGCEAFLDKKVVHISPLVTRHNGVEYSEMGFGGGDGDLNQIHELEFTDIASLGQLVDLCAKRLQGKPETLKQFTVWLEKSVRNGGQTFRLDLHALHDLLGDSQSDALEGVSVDRLVKAIEALMLEQPKKLPPETPHIVSLPLGLHKIETDIKKRFPYARHASYGELRSLVNLFQPKSIYANTVEEGMESIDVLFGDLVAGDGQPDVLTMNRTTIAKDATENEQAAKVIQNHGDDLTIDEMTTITKRNMDPKHTFISPPKRRPEPRPDMRLSSPDGPTKRRHEGSGRDAVESVKRRLAAYKSALGASGMDWATDVKLLSVAGQHCQEPEIEL